MSAFTDQNTFTQYILANYTILAKEFFLSLVDGKQIVINPIRKLNGEKYTGNNYCKPMQLCFK